jgi:hypothetical protein
MFSMASKPRQGEADPSQRRNRAQPVGSDARVLARNAFERAGFADSTLVLRWREIVGDDVARLAQPVKLSESASGGILTLRADPAAAVFLEHDSRALCERINAYLGRVAVAKLRFVPGARAGQVRFPTPARAIPEAPPNDPAVRFRGPEGLKSALVALARLRGRSRPGGSD